LMPWQCVGDPPLQLPPLPTIAEMKLPQMPSIPLPQLPWHTSSSSDEQKQPPSPLRSGRRVQDGAWLLPTDTAPSLARSVPSLAPALGAAMGDGNGGRGAALVSSSLSVSSRALSGTGGRLGPPTPAPAGASISASSIGAHPAKGGGGGGGGGGGVYGGGQGGLWRWAGEWRIDVDGASKSELTNPKSELTNPKSELGPTNPKSELTNPKSELTNPKSEDGWQFAWNWSTGWLSTSNPLTHVRRRRWVRWAEVVPKPLHACAHHGASLVPPGPLGRVRARGRAGLVGGGQTRKGLCRGSCRHRHCRHRHCRHRHCRLRHCRHRYCRHRHCRHRRRCSAAASAVPNCRRASVRAGRCRRELATGSGGGERRPERRGHRLPDAPDRRNALRTARSGRRLGVSDRCGALGIVAVYLAVEGACFVSASASAASPCSANHGTALCPHHRCLPAVATAGYP
jgi:hypothetical protein